MCMYVYVYVCMSTTAEASVNNSMWSARITSTHSVYICMYMYVHVCVSATAEVSVNNTR